MSKNQNALNAAEAEATGAPRSFEIAGVTFTIPKKIKYVKMARMFNSGDEFGAMEVLLGPEQYAALEELEMDDNDLAELNAKMAAVLGVEQGNSPSSQG